jgi:hypothetical protein
VLLYLYTEHAVDKLQKNACEFDTHLSDKNKWTEGSKSKFCAELFTKDF